MILTNKLNLPQPFVDAATNDHEYTEGRYSVTEPVRPWFDGANGTFDTRE